MNYKKVSIRVFLGGFILGAFLSYINKFRRLFFVISSVFYNRSIDFRLFAVVWGVIFGLIMYVSYEIYRKGGWRGLVKTALFIGLFLFAITFFLTFI